MTTYDDLIVELQRQASEADRQVGELRAALAAAEQEAQRYKGILEAAGVGAPKTNAKTTAQRTAKRRRPAQRGISEANLEKLWEAIRSQHWPHLLETTPEETFTVPHLVASTPLNATTVRAGLARLRADGKVRLMGSKRIGSAPRRSNIYAVVGDEQ